MLCAMLCDLPNPLTLFLPGAMLGSLTRPERLPGTGQTIQMTLTDSHQSPALTRLDGVVVSPLHIAGRAPTLQEAAGDECGVYKRPSLL
jgi:hypothetical protein